MIKQNEQTKKSIGKNIKTLRNMKKLSQDDLAFRAGIERSYMGRIERGEANPSLSKLVDIAKALKVKLKNLLEV